MMARMTEQELEQRINDLGSTIAREQQTRYRYEIILDVGGREVTCAGDRRYDALYAGLAHAKQAQQASE